MPYLVKFTNSVCEVAKNFPPEIKKAAKAALKELAKNTDHGKELQAELSIFRSYRFRRYRIVYNVDAKNKFVVVWAIGHRCDIYEHLGEYLLQNNGTRS
jgi:mRNA-degrading endonuclease RelE of RelBE toxin-antitoxin system